jgi:hypothetical protein
MKNLITSLALLVTLSGFSQSKSTSGMVVTETVSVNNVSVVVTVDSAEEIKSTFKIEDFREILELSDDDEVVSFKIICNGLKSHVSYKIEGNSNDKEAFLFGIKKIRTAAINYYNNKN